MDDYNFSKKYVSDNGIVSYEEIVLDNNVKRNQYLPYLNYLDENIVDEYNKFILKRRFGFYRDQNNPNIFKGDFNRLINDSEKIENLKKEYNNLVEFSSKLSLNFDDAIYKIDYYNRNAYYTYKYICEINLNAEINRLYNILGRFQSYKMDSIKKKYTIKHLFIIMFLIYFIFLLFYNLFN